MRSYNSVWIAGTMVLGVLGVLGLQSAVVAQVSPQGAMTETGSLSTRDEKPEASYEFPMIFPGQYVRVTTSTDSKPTMHEGTIVGVADDGLLVRLDARPRGWNSPEPQNVALAFAAVDRIEVGEHDNRLGEGLLFGAAAGAMLVAVVESARGGQRFFLRETEAFWVVLGGIGGLALGGIFGANVHHTTWTEVPPESYTVALETTPALPLRLRFGLSY